MKFLSDIEIEEGLRDDSGDLGTAGQVLSSTGTATNWIDSTSGSIGGSIADNQIAVGAATANNIEGNTDFTYIDGRMSLGDSNAIPSMYIGVNAGTNATTGAANVGVGRNSMELLETAYSNSAFGVNSLGDAVNTNVAQNTAIGQDALALMTNGEFNTALGDGAGYYHGTNSAGLFNSSQSVYLGASAYPAANAQTNQVVIGYEAVGGGSNTVTLGNDDIDTFRIPGLGSTNGHVLTYSTTADGFILAAGGGGGGGIGGTISSTQVAFGATTGDEIDGTSTFTYADSGSIETLSLGDNTNGQQTNFNLSHPNVGGTRARYNLFAGNSGNSLKGYLQSSGNAGEVTLLSNANLVLDSGSTDDIIMASQSGSKVGIGNTSPSEKLEVTGRIKASAGVQVGTEPDNVAALGTVGTFRYKLVNGNAAAGTNYSYVDMVMQTDTTGGLSSYEWVNIVTNRW